MQTKNYTLLAVLLVASILCFANTDVNAQACDPNNPPNNPACGSFNGNTIEFLGTQSATCNLPSGSSTFVPCTAYIYRYTGSSTNQINVAIPKAVMTKFTSNDKTVAGCSQLVTDGSGDPTTHFGINLLTHNICRVAVTGSALSTPFTIKADASTPDLDSWQVRQSSTQVFFDSLLGPGVPAAPIAETAATVTTSEGVSVSYTNVGGQITITGGSGRVVPINNTKLCILNTGGPVTFSNAQGNWTCETITFATEQCDIKTAGTDPCRFIGGSCVLFP